MNSMPILDTGPLPSITRRHLLLDGRRVQVSDLLEANLLAAGATLRFDQTRTGPTFRATVRDDGSLELDDGRVAQTLSGAARMATAGGSYDGWLVWVVEGQERSLDALRRELLKQKADQEKADASEKEKLTGDPVDADPSDRFTWLEAQRRLVDDEELPKLAVRALLRRWGASVRNDDVMSRIRSDLANHGLSTDPDFRDVGLDTDIELVLTTTGPSHGATDSDARSDDEDETDQLDTGLKIGTLRSAMGGLTSVAHTADVEEAITKMMVNDFSQIAVLRGPRTVVGAVSWRSIAQARNVDPSATLADATIPATVVKFDTNLTASLTEIQEEDFVFVSDSKNLIVGIVTAADVVSAYGNVATPFLLLGELDRALRAVIRRCVAIEEVVSLCDPDGARGINDFDDLSIGDYERVLENPTQWGALGWNLHRSSFTAQLQRVRQLRNDVMHFNPDPIPDDAVRMIEALLSVVRRYGTTRG